MAQIGTGPGNGKRAVDHEIPLVPFIDLLLCCVMFLLATAVWTELSRLEVNASSGETADAAPAGDPPPRLFVRLGDDEVVLMSEAGAETAVAWDAASTGPVREQLRQWRSLAASDTEVVVAPDDDVSFDDVVAVMDIAIGEGFADVGLSGQLTL